MPLLVLTLLTLSSGDDDEWSFSLSPVRRQEAQTKWKSSCSASSGEIPWHLLCCQTPHFSQAMLCDPSS